MKTLLIFLVLIFTLPIFAQEPADSISVDTVLVYGRYETNAAFVGDTVIAKVLVQNNGSDISIDPFPSCTLRFGVDQDVIDNLTRIDSLTVLKGGQQSELIFQFEVIDVHPFSPVFVLPSLSFNDGSIIIEETGDRYLFHVFEPVSSPVVIQESFQIAEDPAVEIIVHILNFGPEARIDSFPNTTLRFKDETGGRYEVSNLRRKDSILVVPVLSRKTLWFEFNIPINSPPGDIDVFPVISVNEGSMIIEEEEPGCTFTVRQDSTSSLIEDNHIPLNFDLKQNYPNPFNPTTAIHFNLPEASPVTLIIYDINGREVTRLSDHQRYNAGGHEVQWDASRYASGIYYYRIESGEFQDVKKMVLIK